MAPSPLPRLFVLEDDALYQRALAARLRGHFVPTFFSASEALVRGLQEGQEAPALVLVDIDLGDGKSGLDALPAIRAVSPTTRVVVHSGLTEYEWAVAAMRQGAVDFIPKATPEVALISQLRALVKKTSLRHTGARPALVSSVAPAMRKVMGFLEKIAPFAGNVLITGEPGSGKEAAAQSLRISDQPFVTMDAATLSEQTADSILFGHVRGAFTGADRAHRGLMAQAHGGVLFLDEIGNLSLAVQAKLLRALAEGEIRPLGSGRAEPASCRVVAATNQDLALMAESGAFRSDLLERLGVFVARVPPLRERPEDIVPLAHSFVHYFCDIAGRPPASLDDEALRRLVQYAWPGNIRELANAIQHAIAMHEENVVTVRDLPGKLLGEAPVRMREAFALPRVSSKFGRISLRDQMREYERALLADLYRQLTGNVAEMARQLLIDRSQLFYKLCDYGIHRPKQS